MVLAFTSYLFKEINNNTKRLGKKNLLNNIQQWEANRSYKI